MMPVYRDVPRRISSRVYMMSLHRDVPGERDVSTSLKKRGKIDNSFSKTKTCSHKYSIPTNVVSFFFLFLEVLLGQTSF